MQTFTMMLQASGFALAMLVIVTLIGFGVTAWGFVDGDLELLVVPIVGLAVTAVGIQLLTPVLPPWLTLVLLLAAFGIFSGLTAWKKRAPLRKALRRQWLEIGAVLAAALLLYQALLAYVFAARFFTLAGWPSDNIEFYAPAGQYLGNHAFNANQPLAIVDNPTTRYLARAASEFPNSVGSLDGALSFLSRWEVHRLFDPLDAFLYALVVPATYVLLRQLGVSRAARAAAILLLIANQLLFWVMGLGFQQEMEAMPIFIASLALLIYALRVRNPLAAGLAGFVGGSLLGIYLPIFILFLICAAGYVAVDLVGAGLARHLVSSLRQLGWAMAGGLAASVGGLYWLLSGEGVRFWLSVFGVKYTSGGISTFFPLKFLFGVAPIAALTWPSLPALWWGSRWALVSRWLGVLVPLLLLGGATVFLLKRRLPVLGLIAAAGLYLAYLRFVERYPYGFMKTLTYLVPLTSALIAVGAVELVPTIWARISRRIEFPRPRMALVWKAGSAVAVASLIPILATEAMSTVDMQRLWIKTGPTFPASYEAMSVLPKLVPRGAGILLVNPSRSYADEIKFAAARYYLVENNLALDDKVVPEGQLSIRYSFLLVPSSGTPVPTGFVKLWSDPELGLALYRRGPNS